jgi:hypothetical protein
MSTLAFYNRFWTKGVNVEVDFADNADSPVNPPSRSRQIAYQADWRVQAGGNLRYRRDLNPDNPDGQMTGWTLVQDLGSDRIENV